MERREIERHSERERERERYTNIRKNGDKNKIFARFAWMDTGRFDYNFATCCLFRRKGRGGVGLVNDDYVNREKCS